MSEFLKRLDLTDIIAGGASFSEGAITRTLHYCGWQISVAKLVVQAAVNHPTVLIGDRRVTAQMVDEALMAVKAPDTRNSKCVQAAALHKIAFPLWSKIFEDHFTQAEKGVALRVAAADGTLLLDSSAYGASEMVHAANSLFERGYLWRERTRQGTTYMWRIGFWQLLLEEQAQLSQSLAQSEDAFRMAQADSAAQTVVAGRQSHGVNLQGNKLTIDGVDAPPLLDQVAHALRTATRHLGQAVTYAHLSEEVGGSEAMIHRQLKRLVDILNLAALRSDFIILE